ncbi:MAG: hypothetical protein M0Z31_06295 [Clostridia bacterium]|nr:hypothetical protein [Clostridia bacterium]
MNIKDVHIAINPTNTKAILTVETDEGATIELVADIEQIRNIQKIIHYTAEHIAASTEESWPNIVH